MLAVGEDESSVDTGLVCVFGKATRGLYGLEEAFLARVKGIEAGTNYLAGDIYDDFGGWGGRGENYLKGTRVTAGQKQRKQEEGDEQKAKSGGRQLNGLR